MWSATQARKLAEQVLALGRKQARDGDVLVEIVAQRRANTRFGASEISSTGDVDDVRVEVTIGFGKRQASASANQLDAASLRDLVARAARLARLAPENPERMPLLGAQRFRSVPAAYDAATVGLGATDRAEAARIAIEAGRAKDLQVAGYYEHGSTLIALASSAGLFGAHSETSAKLSLTARTSDGTGSGWAGADGVRAAALEPARLASIAVDKAVRSAKPRRLEPGRYTVVLEPAAVTGLLETLVSNLDRRRADEGRSFFSRPGGGTRVGESLFADSVTLRSDPYAAATPGRPFDREGNPYEATTWIDRGALTALPCSRYWASKKGIKALPPPRTVQLVGGSTSSTDLIAGVRRGLLVTRFWYIRSVDPKTILTTGLTRDGVFLIENGAVVAPVNNFRFNESPVTMLRNVEALGKDLFRVPSSGFSSALYVPALRAREFHFASISDAV